MLKILIKFESIYIIVIYLFYRVDFNTLACNWFRWENVLGDAKKQWLSCIQNHDILINNIFRLNHINSIRITFWKIKIIFILNIEYMLKK